MNTTSTKAELRKKLLAERKALSRELVSKRSKILVNKLNELVDYGTKNIHCFLPLAGDHEPDLREFIKNVISQNKVVYTSDPTIRTVEKIENFELTQFQFGNDLKFDLIIVPMLGFSGLHRLGFGGGFYDKFLATQPQAKKIGVCFRDFELNNLPVESHDVELDKIITA